MKKISLFLIAVVSMMIPWRQAETIDSTQYWIKIRATNKFERSLVANTGVSIEAIREDFVVAIGNLEEKKQLEKLGLVDVSFPISDVEDFPSEDREFHNYTELTEELHKLVNDNPGLVEMSSIGKSTEGRDIWVLHIVKNPGQAAEKPGVIFMGGHHSREHVSVEMPLRFAQHLLSEYKNGNARIKGLVDSRDIHIIPAVNPDGLEFDVSTGHYKMWRKNRRTNGDGTYGVDLNRNYGFQWGTGGSSTNTSSDVYMGPNAFSEPETQAIKKYVETHTNLSILLSFHTYSKLILYPWGHKYDPISDSRDRGVYETMAQKMAQWNGYTPEQSSELYIASGDTTDWAYGQQKVISFTFELDPGAWEPGGFYPGAGVIPSVVQKNIEPCLYLLEYADNPYRVLQTSL